MKRLLNLISLFFILSVLGLLLWRFNQQTRESYLPRASSPTTPRLGRSPATSSKELLPLELRINSPQRPDFEIIAKHPDWLLATNLIDIREPDYRLHLFPFYREYLAEKQIKGLLLRDLGACPELLGTSSCPEWWNISQKELVAELRQQLTDPVIYFQALPFSEEGRELNRHYFLSLDGVVVGANEKALFEVEIRKLVPEAVYLKKTILSL